MDYRKLVDNKSKDEVEGILKTWEIRLLKIRAARSLNDDPRYTTLILDLVIRISGLKRIYIEKFEKLQTIIKTKKNNSKRSKGSDFLF